MVPVMPAQAGIRDFGRIDRPAVDGRNKRKIGPQHLAQFGQHGHSDYGHSDTVTVIWKSASVTHPFEPDKKM